MSLTPPSSHGSAAALTGDATPIGAVTPANPGVLYLDTTGGTAYLSIGVTSADWVQLGGVQTDVATGAASDKASAALIGPAGNGVLVEKVGAATALGFFGTSPVNQPAAPVLLSDVIAGLQDLGLFAS